MDNSNYKKLISLRTIKEVQKFYSQNSSKFNEGELIFISKQQIALCKNAEESLHVFFTINIEHSNKKLTKLAAEKLMSFCTTIEEIEKFEKKFKETSVKSIIFQAAQERKGEIKNGL